SVLSRSDFRGPALAAHIEHGALPRCRPAWIPRAQRWDDDRRVHRHRLALKYAGRLFASLVLDAYARARGHGGLDVPGRAAQAHRRRRTGSGARGALMPTPRHSVAVAPVVAVL